MNFHHVAIIVSDRQKALSFYGEILGFSLIHEEFRTQRNSYKMDFEREGMRLEIFTFPDAPIRPSYPEAQGLRHLAFGVEDLDQWHDVLKKKNVSVEDIREDHQTGKRFFFFADPDDLPIEIMEN